MQVRIAITQRSRNALKKFGDIADRWPRAVDLALDAAAAATASKISELHQTNQLPLKSRRGGMGLAGAISSWRDGDKVYVGVPANTEPAAYAHIQEIGGDIHAKPGKALAVPLFDAARMYTSPRDAEADGHDLTMIKRNGRPPLLVEVLGDVIKPWYVLLKRVTIKATNWFTIGVQQSSEVRRRAFDIALNKALEAA